MGEKPKKDLAMEEGAEEVVEHEKTSKGKKVAKKEKRKKDKKSSEKDNRKRKREEKKQKKKEILDKIPKVNEDGISYTKQQIRRMVKRVERGLPPVPTAEEEAELKRQEAQLRKEEEMELAGMLYNREQDRGTEGSDEENEDEDQEAQDERADNSDGDGDGETDEAQGKKGKDDGAGEEENGGKTIEKNPERPQKKRKMSKKPVPKDYVCQACQNKHDFPHWIYDCPDKVTVPGTNHVAAGKRNTNNAPSAKKVFVSGLFFDTNPTDVKDIFQSCGKVTSVKLLKFNDTGRCKGQAFVVFDTEESAKKALEMTGTKITSDDDNAKGNKKKQKKDKATPTKRELELKVTKVLSRAFTKKKR
jgi:hypothetical protein